VGVPQFATLAGLEIHAGFASALLQSLAELGLEVEQWSEEYGPGQIEVNLRYGDALSAADGLVTFKEAFRALARQQGLLGTFMPKPFEDQAGTGLHVHLSAVSPDGDGNLFDDPADELGLSRLGRHALGGLLAHGEALTALGATTVNSYKRFLPGSWAPTHIVASYASRAAFVRIPERETARRLELRVGDGAGNPYIYLTGIIAAMLDGIERAMEPHPIVSGDVGALSPAEADAFGARPVPRTLGQALDALERDEVICRALGPIIAPEFIKVKRSEWDDFVLHVGQWDRDWYFGRY
jgi:glutamine synthetase